jgi:putative membrane protein
MHFFWWLFWIALIGLFFSLATPVSRRRVRRYDDPLSILQRRYAAGDISNEEYEERKVRLLEDARPLISAGSKGQRRIDRHQPA